MKINFFWVKNEKSFDFSFGYGKILIPLHPQNVQIYFVCMIFAKLIIAGIAQLVECQPSKLNVASSSLVARSISNVAALAQW